MEALLAFLFAILILIIVVIALRALFSKLSLDPAIQTVIWCIIAVLVLIFLWNSFGSALSGAKFR